jgi:thiosulfate dehydrogenase (quinone) large subunit
MGVQTRRATERIPEYRRDSMGAQTVRTGELYSVGWLRAVAPLWPLGLARILYGILWWQQSKWKVPSDDFGRKSGGGLWYWVQQEIQHPTVNAYRDFLVNVLVPNWTFFGWMTLITETFIGVTLILGLGTRLGSLLAIGMAANITIGILSVPNEWGWTYTMLIMLPVLFLLTGAGRSFGLDAFLAPPLEHAAERGNALARLARWLV